MGRQNCMARNTNASAEVAASQGNPYTASVKKEDKHGGKRSI
jgi:hypothetical protein